MDSPLRQAAIACAISMAARWPDDLLETARRWDWGVTAASHARLGAATVAALDAEHDRRVFGTGTAVEWARVVDEVAGLPAANLRDLTRWTLVPGLATDDLVGLWPALACVATAARITEPADDRIIAELEASLTTDQETFDGRI